MNGSTRLALGIVVVGAVALVAADLLGFIDAGTDGRIGGLVALLAIAVWVGAGAFSHYAGRGSQALSHAVIWLGIVAVIALLYHFQAPIMAALGQR